MKKDIALALSGGGVRAMAYHVGVLKCLAEHNCFERVSHLSTVSGGSLLIGLVYSVNNFKWPTSREFEEFVLPEICKLLTSKNLQIEMYKFLSLPWNWKYVFRRANALSIVLEKIWNISGYMADIKETPEWSVNGTTIETGRRFRFKSKDCGDYKTGYTTSEGFRLSTAMAVSAAFPGGIGPLVINTKNHIWKKKVKWGAPSDSEKVISQRFKKLHIYDGGVYDNLGTEPLFDSGNNIPKVPDSKIIVSDAGKPLFDQKHGSVFNPFRLSRILDIALDQARALRVRSLFGYLNSIEKAGAYLMIGQSPNELLGDNGELIDANWLSANERKLCAKYPTDLKRISHNHLEFLVKHGYESLMASNIQNKVLN